MDKGLEADRAGAAGLKLRGHENHPMGVRSLTIVPLLGVLVLAGCGRTESASEKHREANTPAGKVGQVAHGVAKEAGKIAKTAGKQLAKAGHEAREGWKEAARNDPKKDK